MFCSASVSIHLLRGLVALGLIIGAIYSSSYGAIVLIRGCPMCWLVGLFETLHLKPFVSAERNRGRIFKARHAGKIVSKLHDLRDSNID
jgi:hypothetical protein